MHLEDIRLFHFRNLADQDVQFSSGLNLILGLNGIGKTNLLEAIYLLSVAKSYRTSRVLEMVRRGEENVSVFANIVAQDGRLELGISVTEGKKTTHLNGSPVGTISDFVGKFITVTFSPLDISFIKGPPVERRRFFDKHMVDLEPHTIFSLMEYNRAIKSKNLILRSLRIDLSALDVWNELLIRSGVVITNKRRSLLKEASDRARAICRQVLPGEGEIEISLKGRSLHDGDALTETSFRQSLDEIRDREIAKRMALFGPHRDDITISLNGYDARSFASQGQSRSIILAIKIAMVELIEEQRATSPVVLLDDMESELDSERSAIFLRKILEKPRQIFLTGTARQGEKIGQVYRVSEGKIEHVSC